MDVLAIVGDGSKVANHLMTVVDDTYLLNVAPRVGVHLLRLFVIWNKVCAVYRRRGLQVL